jgi:hypothetical protein
MRAVMDVAPIGSPDKTVFISWKQSLAAAKNLFAEMFRIDARGNDRLESQSAGAQKTVTKNCLNCRKIRCPDRSTEDVNRIERRDRTRPSRRGVILGTTSLRKCDCIWLWQSL